MGLFLKINYLIIGHSNGSSENGPDEKQLDYSQRQSLVCHHLFTLLKHNSELQK